MKDASTTERRPDSESRLQDLEQSNAMWGWISGGIVLALILMFVFSNTQSGFIETPVRKLGECSSSEKGTEVRLECSDKVFVYQKKQ